MDQAKGFFNSSGGTNYIVELDFSPVYIKILKDLKDLYLYQIANPIDFKNLSGLFFLDS